MNKLSVEDTHFHSNNHIHVNEKLIDLSRPIVMGIVNTTPDSFYKSSRKQSLKELLLKVEQQLIEGASIIDIGGYSSRPGAIDITTKEEIDRVIPAITAIKKEFDTIISLDTFRSEVAKEGLENGASIINDISAWELDKKLLSIVSHYKCPYILMHMNGTPSTMQNTTKYSNLFNDIITFLSKKIQILEENGINDIIIDPGFGFGKTLEQNYELLNNLECFKLLNKPILAGLSRKSMIYNKLESSPEEALNGTTVLNTIAISKNASVLRVHDVKEAMEVIKLTK